MSHVPAKSKSPARRSEPAHGPGRLQKPGGPVRASEMEAAEPPSLSAFYLDGPAVTLGAQAGGGSASSAGNGASGVPAALQCKLAVGNPGDHFENEADSTADRVVSGQPAPAITPLGQASLGRMQLLQTCDSGACEEEDRAIQPCSECRNETRSELEPPSVQLEKIREAETGQPEHEPVREKAREAPTSPEEERVQTDGWVVQKKAATDERDETAATEVVHQCQECGEDTLSPGTPTSKGSEEVVQSCEACGQEKEEEPPDVQTAARGGSVAPADEAGNPSSGAGSDGNAAAVSQAISHPGPGTPLAPAVQGELEPRLGKDLRGVRVHQDGASQRLARSLHARAFTHGQDIWLGEGESPHDLRLMAHESAHVVQQTSGEVGLHTIQRQECEAEEEERGSEEQAREAESAPATGTCIETNAPAEEPPEGTEEPNREETPADVEANEGASVDERQANAPPPNENAPEGEQGIAETGAETEAPSQDPCAVREAAALQAVETVGISEAGAVTASEAPPPQVLAAPLTSEVAGSEAAPGEAPEGAAQGPAPGERGENAFLVQAAAPAAIAIQPEGLGEAASPEVAGERDQLASSSDKALATLDDTGSAAVSVASTGVRFMEPTGEKDRSEYERANGAASDFLSSAGARLSRFIDEGVTGADEIRQEAERRKVDLDFEIQQHRSNTTVLFAQLRAEAEAQALVATVQVETRHILTLLDIEAQAIEARNQLTSTYEEKLAELEQANSDQIARLDEVYQTGYDDLIAIGTEKAGQARSRAAEHESAYRNADNAPPDIQRRVRNREKDGFWDGYLTYNRYMARADAAREVGQQYAEGFENQARARADHMLCGKSRDLEITRLIASQGVESLGCARDNAIDAIETQRASALGLAERSRQETLNTIQGSLDATLAQLRQREAGQLAMLYDYGVRQMVAIERDSERAVGAVLQGINDAAVSILDYLSQFRAQVESSPPPTPGRLSRLIEGETAQLETSFDRAHDGFDEAVSQSQTGLDTGLEQARTALQGLYQGGADDAFELASGFRQATLDLVTGAMSGYEQIMSTFAEGMAAELDNSTAILAGVVTGITGVYEQINTGIETRFQEAGDQMSQGFQESLDQDLDRKVCAQAEKAAADVQPWWKGVLKVLLIIVVIVVVAVVLGPAIIGAVGAAATALAGSLGAGAALAGAIGAWVGPIIGGAIVGAIAGAAIQVGSNAIYGRRWNEGLKEAVIAGAIGGALGGLGGQFAQVLLGRVAATGFSRFALQFGTEAAFDVVGGILGDLATGNPITLEGVLLGAAIGGAVQLSTTGLGGLARARVRPTGAGAADSLVTRLARGRIGRAAERITDVQSAVMAAGERVGARAPTPEATRAALAGARARIEEGELFPGRAAPEPEGTPARPVEAGEEAPQVRPEPEEGVVPGGVRGRAEAEATARRSTHEDAVEVESGVVARRDLPGDRAVSVHRDGRIFVCTECAEIRLKYAAELSDPLNAAHLSELNRVEAIPDPQAKLDAAVRLRNRLDVLRSSGISKPPPGADGTAIARAVGLPDAPDGYQWVRTGSGVEIRAIEPGRPIIRYDDEIGAFVPSREPGEFGAALRAQVELDAENVIAAATSNRELRRLAATSRAGVPDLDIVSPSFANIRADATAFPGVRVDGNTFTITNPDAFMARVRDLYAASGQSLHPTTERLILSHIRSTASYDTHAGLPGLHAEVRSVNNIFHALTARGYDVNNFDLARLQVATYKLAPGPGHGGAFEACRNCGSILPPLINILTGRRF